MKKPIVLAVFFLWQAAFGLQAPYLYSADSVADTAVQLTWRNNSVDYQGVIILRKSVAAGQYSIIDTAPGSATSFTDTVRPAAQVTYYYALTAYSLTEHADTSNGDSVRMTLEFTITNPKNLTVSYDTLMHNAHLQFYDSSTVETGYKIYRSTNFATFDMIKDIISSMPSKKGVISFIDSAVFPNTWYRYYSVAYNSQQSLSSGIDTLFTFDVGALVRNIPKTCIISNKLSTFPTKYKGWSLKSGDTIVLNETGAPDSTTFSIIDVSYPSAPMFAGTGKSSAALLGKASLTKGPYIFGVFDSLNCYKYYHGEIKVESKTIWSPADIFLGFLSDTTFITLGYLHPFGFNICMATRYASNNGILSFIDTVRFGVGGKLNGFGVSNSKIYSGKYFFNAVYSDMLSSNSTFEIVDFNYSPTVRTIIYHNARIDYPIIVGNIFIDAPALKSANNIFIDTVKNLAFALSDTDLAIYNCQITTGTTQKLSPRPYSAQYLRIGQEKGNSSCLIFLPRHSHPADVSIFTMSGRLAYRFNNVSGESINWRRGNKTGVYLIKAVIDGQTYSAKAILTK